MPDINVILVDTEDNEIGTEEKLRAHQNGGKLHRALSVFVFNSKGQTMIQRRALTKYHSAGQWANTVCSHPYPGENVLAAAHRRLMEEMGFDCEIREAFDFPYRADVGHGLTEHEYDHVLFGSYEGKPKLNAEEVMDWKWVGLEELRKGIRSDPDSYAPWLRLMINKVIEERSAANGPGPS